MATTESTYGDDLDFHKHLLGKFADCNRRTGGERSCEHLCVNLVHRNEISHIRKEYGGLDNIVDRPSGISPVAGLTGIWPEMNTNEPVSIAWL